MYTFYLASPLFTPQEREFNEKITREISKFGRVFLPQRDGMLLAKLLQQGVPPEIARKQIFEKDVHAINNCKILIAVLDGRSIDEGVAFELGYAFARNKICLGLKTDDRVMLLSGDNPMITGACLNVWNRLDDLICSLDAIMSRAA